MDLIRQVCEGDLEQMLPSGLCFTTMTRTANYSFKAHKDPHDVGPSVIRYFEYSAHTMKQTDITQGPIRTLVYFYISELNAWIALRHGDVIVLNTGLQHLSILQSDPTIPRSVTQVFGAGCYAGRKVLSAAV